MSQKQQQEAQLFNGESVIRVVKGKDGIYRFATGKHGAMDYSRKEQVEDFMKRNGYRCKFYTSEPVKRLVPKIPRTGMV